jgi:hypothetical protein
MRFPCFIEDSLAFEGFLQSLGFIEISVQRVRELSRSRYQMGGGSNAVSRFW